MRDITDGELNKILKKHEIWIATDWKEGEKADLSYANLSGANLSGIRLCEANLCSADLSSADLRKTDFFRADLSEADLSEADLCGAMLYAADLSGADLSGACLEGVKGLTKAGLIEKPSKVVINSEKVIKDSFIQNGALRLWHMTHKENIQSILEHGILNHYDAHSLLVKPVDISDPDAQRWRDKTEPYYHRKIHDYAPLYINPRNPMLYVRRNMQSELCLIEVFLSVMFESEYLITDGNAAASATQFFDSVNHIKELPWDVLNGTSWTHYDDGKRKKCAEVLVYPKVTPKHIGIVYCYSRTTLNTLGNCGRKVELSHNLFF